MHGLYGQALGIVQQRLLDPRLLELEFRSVVRRDQLIEHTVEHSQRPENGSRNRYVNVLPYDFNRVKLSSCPPGYVNASHVKVDDGPYGAEHHYIAAQGPLTATVEEFWCMCLEKDCTAIVMLTNVVESGVNKCASYFPPKVHDVMSFPKVQVTTTGVVQAMQNNLTIREIQVVGMLGSSRKSLSVTHYHYHSWPDHGTPDESRAIRKVCDALPPASRNGEAVVVHCSAGIGRTGTFIVIDVIRARLQKICEAVRQGSKVPPSALQQALAVPDLVHQLRQQRMGMVQTVEQYVFIYQALQEELQECIRAAEAGVQA